MVSLWQFRFFCCIRQLWQLSLTCRWILLVLQVTRQHFLKSDATVLLYWFLSFLVLQVRGGSRTAATTKVELFVIIVNGCKSKTVITKSSTLDVAAFLDPSLQVVLQTGNDQLNDYFFVLCTKPLYWFQQGKCFEFFRSSINSFACFLPRASARSK